MPLPERDDMFNTRGKMLQDITVALGGRVAEEEVLDDITTGASQDIKQATSLAKSMVTKFGMSEASDSLITIMTVTRCLLDGIWPIPPGDMARMWQQPLTGK